MSRSRHIFAESLELESGVVLPRPEVVYHTFGKLAADGGNVVWICHALTGNSDPSEWWDGLVGSGRLFDPARFFVVCVNMPGSCYGSSGPLSVNPSTGKAYGRDFPRITVRDMARAFVRLRKHLGIRRISTCIGGSMGGQVALEWSVLEPAVIERLVVIATNARHSAWGKALNAAQRMAIEADPAWSDVSGSGPERGLAAARAVAMISYRSYDVFERRQQDDTEGEAETKVAGYLLHQGNKLVERFDPYSYWLLTHAMDSHDVGRGRGGIEVALSAVAARTLVIGVFSDVLFPVAEQKFIADRIAGAVLRTVESEYGHDGFLIEYAQLESIIGGFLGETAGDVSAIHSGMGEIGKARGRHFSPRIEKHRLGSLAPFRK